MATKYYKYACPSTPKYFVDNDRPSIGWICKNARRERYVSDGLKWNVEELEEHQQLLKEALKNRGAYGWENCLKNLQCAIDLKRNEDPKYIEYATAHFYENYDLS